MYLLHDFVMIRALKITQLEQPYLKLMKPRDANRVGKNLFSLFNLFSVVLDYYFLREHVLNFI